MKNNLMKINSHFNKNIDISNFQELSNQQQPYEGFLFIDSGYQWAKRLFRFNGETLVCLTPKIILIPNNPKKRNSCQSLDPLLIATVTKDDSDNLVTYYYVPEWTVNLDSITSISLLRKKGNDIPPEQLDLRLSIQTIHGIRRVMKSSNPRELEQWSFVLTKMRDRLLRTKDKNNSNIGNSNDVNNNLGNYNLVNNNLGNNNRLSAPIQNDRPISMIKPDAVDLISTEPDHFISPLSNEKMAWIEAWVDSSMAQINEKPYEDEIPSTPITEEYHNIVDPLLPVQNKKNQNTSYEYTQYFQDTDSPKSLYPSHDFTHPIFYHNSSKGNRIMLVKQETTQQNNIIHNPLSLLDSSPLEKIQNIHINQNQNQNQN